MSATDTEHDDEGDNVRYPCSTFVPVDHPIAAESHLKTIMVNPKA